MKWEMRNGKCGRGDDWHRNIVSTLITLGFRDPDRLREFMWEYGALAATAFHWPVRMNIDGTEMLGRPGMDPYIQVFALGDFIRGGLATLEAARTRGERAYYLEDFPGAIYMEMLDDGHVLVFCTLEHTSAVANYYEFHQAWLDFADWFRKNAPPFEASSNAGQYEREWHKWFQGHFSVEPERCHYDFFEDEQQEIREARKRWLRENKGGN